MFSCFLLNVLGYLHASLCPGLRAPQEWLPTLELLHLSILFLQIAGKGFRLRLHTDTLSGWESPGFNPVQELLATSCFLCSGFQPTVLVRLSAPQAFAMYGTSIFYLRLREPTFNLYSILTTSSSLKRMRTHIP